MSVQKPALTTAINNWTQRANFYAGLGIAPDKYYQIAQQDLNNVATTGAAPMSTAAVNAAMAAQYTGRSLIQPTTTPTIHRGLFGDVLHVVTSVPSDVKNLVTGFLPGLAHFAAHFPSEAVGAFELIKNADNAQWMTDHGYEPSNQGSLFHQMAASFRDIAKQPIFGLIPGVGDVANLTSASGRAYLSSHPVSAALDVAPAGKILGAGSRVAVRAGEEGSALAALQAGQPLRAGVRGVQAGIRATKPEPGTLLARASDPLTFSNIANKLGYGAEAKQMASARTERERDTSRRVKNLMDDFRHAMLPLDPERRKQVTDEATGLATPTPENEHLVQMAKSIQDSLRTFREAQFRASAGKHGSIVRTYGKGKLEFRAGDRIIGMYRNLDRLTGWQIPHAKSTATKAKRRLAASLKAAQDPNLTAEQRAALTKKIIYQNGMYQNALVRLKKLDVQHGKLLKQINEELHRGGGTAEMSTQVRDQLRTRLKTARQDLFDKAVNDPNHPLYDPTTQSARYRQAYEQMRQDLQLIDDTSNIARLKQILIDPAAKVSEKALQSAEKQFESIRRDSVAFVLKLVHEGHDPIWLHHVDPAGESAATSHRVHIMPDKIPDTEQYTRTVLDFSPGTVDIALGLTRAARQTLGEEANRLFIQDFVLSRAKTSAELEDMYLKLARQAPRRAATHGVSGHAMLLQRREWTTIHPESYGLQTWPGRFNAEELWIPKWMEYQMGGLMHDPLSNRSFFRPGGTYDRVMRVFRFSVLTGPRHVVHVAVAGLLPLMMREPTSVLHLKSAWDIIQKTKRGEPTDYAPLVKNLYDFTDGVAAKAIGHTYGNVLSRYWAKTGANVEQKIARIEETASDMYRVAAALSVDRRGGSYEEAVAIGNKVAVNMDDMTALERTVIKHVFPFYGFTKFLFRFLFTYPVDHPYRAAILSRFATQEQEEWNSLIPEKFMMTLFLGHPDSHGNIKTMDLRNLNPFRSFSNDFTMVGFMQSLNPIAAAPFVARGFNVLDATGPLYPSLEYNVNTGTLQAAPPSGKDAIFGAAEQFLPELGTIDHFIGVTDNMKALKRTNPAAYKATLYSQLNLPGVLSPPITVNLPYVQERAEMDRYKVASQTVSQYQEGKVSADALRQFALIPYRGQYYTPAQFIAYWENLKRYYAQTQPGVDPRALIATPIRKTSQDPLSLLSAQGTQP